MKRARALALAGAALCAACLSTLAVPPRPRRPFDALGGAKPLVVDALFLRAEALRREGRADELPALYRRILEIDPGSDVAVDYLSEVLARDLGPQAPTPAARADWIDEALSLVETALARDPGSARLHWRRADLLENVARGDAVVAQRLLARRLDRRLEALRELAAAARITGSIPRLGRIHLEMAARLAPVLAAERLVAGAPGADEALRLGDEVLRTRRAELDELILDPDDPGSAAFRLYGGLALLRVVRERLEARPPAREEARFLIAQFEKAVPNDPLPGLLAPLVR